MVLSHSSGIENWRWYNSEDTLEILVDPGTQHVYSGEGYEFLAKVVDTILHKPYREYLEERVIQPLGLKRTFCSYDETGENPSNYAIGHNDMGKPLKKWKNKLTWPAYGNHVIAEDYAKLLIAIFSGKHISAETRQEILRPNILVEAGNDSLFYGPGFEILYTPGDTIIAHGGNNSGFKAMVFYSVVSKRGFVFFTNGDRGKLISAKISEMTARLNVRPYFKADFYSQYPSSAIHLLGVYYKERAPGPLFEEVLRLQEAGNLDPNALVELGDVFANDDAEISRRMFEASIRYHPELIHAYYLLGRLHLRKKEYQLAYDNLTKVQQLRPTEYLGIERDIQLCHEKLKQK
jgi:tetratricopeptide (TPR) repeat protein